MDGAKMNGSGLAYDKSDSYELLNGTAAKGSQDLNPTDGLFDEQPTLFSRMAPWLAVALQIIVIAFMIIIIPVNIWMSDLDHGFSATQRNIYATGTTILASLISAFTIAEIRNLWLKSLVQGLGRVPMRTRRIQVLLTISKIRDQFVFYEVSVALLVLGLITSAIVGATTASVAAREYDDYSYSYSGGSTSVNGGATSDCWTDQGSPQGAFAWTDNNTLFALNPLGTDKKCPGNVYGTASKITDALGNAYYPFERELCQFGIGGAIGCDALGAPVDDSTTCGILKAFSCQGYPMGTEACLPVFAKNPVTCRPVAADWYFRDDEIFVLNSSSCQVSTTGTDEGVFINLQNTSITGACPYDRPLGDMTVLFGSTNATDIQNLGALLNDTQFNSTNYAIECNITMTSILEFQKVFYQPDTTLFQNLPGKTISKTDFINGTKESCDPTPIQDGPDPYVPMTSMSQVLNNEAKGTAALLMAHFFNQTLGSIIEKTTYGANSSRDSEGVLLELELAFAESKNVLEDYLGVTMATYMSYYWANNGATVGDSADDPAYKVIYRVSAERVGSGSWWAILYILPSVFSIVILGIFIRRN